MTRDTKPKKPTKRCPVCGSRSVRRRSRDEIDYDRPAQVRCLREKYRCAASGGKHRWTIRRWRCHHDELRVTRGAFGGKQ